MRKTIGVLTLALATAVPAAAGDTYTVDKNHSEASFAIRHMLSRVRGTFGDFEGKIEYDRQNVEKSSVEFRIKAASIDTNNQRRDDHLRSQDFFWVEKHPEIVFTSTKVVPKGADTFDVIGTLTMRGVTKEITLPVTFAGEQKDNRGATRAGFETFITLNRKDYEIVWNQTLDAGGVVLGDEVQVSISLAGIKQVPAASN